MLEELVNVFMGMGEKTAFHVSILCINLLLWVCAEPLISAFNEGKDIRSQVKIFRTAAILFLLMHLLDIFLVNTIPAYEHYFIRIGSSLAALYACVIGFNVVSYFSRQKFGDEKLIDEKTVYLDTYSSRLVDLVALVFVVLVVIYWMINIWELEGLLQTTGLLGVTFAFLALTNNIWAPDIYYGMVILNSQMLSDGDVIKINGGSDEYIINKVNFMYTTLLDVRNNHRVVYRNSQLVSSRVDNLSRRASVDGLRHALHFNIGYPDFKNEQDPEVRAQIFSRFRNKVQKVFDEAYEKVEANTDVKINRKMEFEVAITHSGDYALTFTLYYYMDVLPNTKVTKTVRGYLLRTPQLIQEAVNETAIAHSISLATPMLVHTEIDTGASGKTLSSAQFSSKQHSSSQSSSNQGSSNQGSSNQSSSNQGPSQEPS